MGFSTAGGGPSSTGPKMNVTPLIDVLLVLIIVFMLVVVEQRPTGLEAQIPQPPDPKDQHDSAAQSDDSDSDSSCEARCGAVAVLKKPRRNIRRCW
jgi:biopolymer transport protein ExbD